MGFLKSKKGILVTAVLLMGCALLVCAANTSAEGGETSIFSNSKPLIDEQQEPGRLDDSIGDALRRMVFAVLIIILLGAAAIYASKKVLPRFSQMQGKKIKVIETIHLGTRKAVHLLEIGGQQILVGSTNDRITKLADIFSEKGFPLEQSGDSEVTE
jgi:flagellar biosynthetic protein FliO